MKINEWLDTQLGIDIWTKKYQQNGETFDEWIDRVSGGNEDVAQLIRDKKFLFGGRILASRGITDRKVTYSNCYVLPQVEDSIEGIYDTAKHLARTFSYGGGVGIDISNLRAKGMPVNNAAKTTSGAVSFMETFSQVSSVIGQEGRRGALMISMDCNHPDVEDFIDAKKNTDKLEGCNISVRCTDDFMGKSNKDGTKEKELMMKLAENNWNYAEPGILFWDEINNNNLLSEYIADGEFEYAGVNPCAEEPLPAGGSCLLGAINLSEFVVAPFTDHAAFDIPAFREAVRIAVIALNEVLDEGLPLHPLEIQRQTVADWRQIGLGIMGFADMLIKLGIPYGSGESLMTIDVIGKAMNEAGINTSVDLAVKKGSFPKFDADKILHSNFMQHMSQAAKCNVTAGLRNSQLFTIAPTGTISTMLGVSGGVEPLFDVEFTRTTKSLHGEDKTYTVKVPIVEKCIEAKKKPMEFLREITWSKTIGPITRIDVQAKWQEYIDASISSTVNLPESATVQDVFDLYQHAWFVGCKGLTIFRDGCARTAILNSTTKEEKEEPVEKTVNTVDTDIENCIAKGTKLSTGCGSLWITCYFHKETGQLCHIFLDKGSTGGCNSFMNGLSRMISLAGKKGASIDDIIEQLNSTIACPSYAVAKATKNGISPGKGCPSAIGKAIKKLSEEFKKEYLGKTENIIVTKEDFDKYGIVISNSECPTCGAGLTFTGGCNVCPNCGWSKCD